MTEATNFLDFCFNNKRINETDKQDILLLHAKLQTYNYYDVFSPDVIWQLRNTSCINNEVLHLDCSNIPIIDNNGGHYYIRGTAIHKNKNRIFKLWITNKEHPCTNDICFQMLIEYYFHNIFLNSITDNILIVPQPYKYGKVILDTNNEILYFYEMEYYDSKKYILDSINSINDECKVHKIHGFNDILNNGYNALCNMESRISVFHIDHDTPLWFNNVVNDVLNGNDNAIHVKAVGYLIQNADILYSYNTFIFNDKYVVIDFGEAGRNNYDKQSQIAVQSSVYQYIERRQIYNY